MLSLIFGFRVRRSVNRAPTVVGVRDDKEVDAFSYDFAAVLTWTQDPDFPILEDLTQTQICISGPMR